MSSRSATVLVILVVAFLAFCLASVFGAMTGPISILPNESESGGVLDNLSAITDSDDNYKSYGSQSTNDYSSYSSDDSKSEQQVETTTDTSQNQASQQSSSSDVETTADDSSSSSGSSSRSGGSSSSSNGPQVETTTG